MNVSNMRVIQRGEQVRFTFEPREPLGIVGQRFGQDFEGDVATELRVACPINLSHAARADGGEDLVRSESRSGCEHHRAFRIWSRPRL
jgi:hypothetical protein